MHGGGGTGWERRRTRGTRGGHSRGGDGGAETGVRTARAAVVVRMAGVPVSVAAATAQLPWGARVHDRRRLGGGRRQRVGAEAVKVGFRDGCKRCRRHGCRRHAHVAEKPAFLSSFKVEKRTGI